MSSIPEEFEGVMTDKITAQFPSLAGKSAIVSGASRGIGLGIAHFLGRQEMKLTLCARTAESGEKVAATLTDLGIDCQWVTADLWKYEDAKAVLDAALAKYGRVDLLVNNAASLWARAIQDTDEEVYTRTIDGNVRMFFGLSHYVSRHMIEAGGGCIINISSVGGLRAHKHDAGYDASKGAMDALTRSMAIDLAEHGIRVNSVAPGATRNRPPHAHRPGRRHSKRRHSARQNFVPMGRVGTPEEMGAAVAFLASDAGAYVTGTVLYVDGGLTAQLAPPGISF